MPKSANEYDSYAEVWIDLSDKREALIHNERASAMEPKNSNALRIVAELEKEGLVEKRARLRRLYHLRIDLPQVMLEVFHVIAHQPVQRGDAVRW